MNIQVLPLKVLVARQVVRNRVDYSAFLNGTVKEELDRLDKLAGDFRIVDSRVVIDEGKGLSSESWQERKTKLDTHLYKQTSSPILKPLEAFNSFRTYN